jgi:hypothetical protein
VVVVDTKVAVAVAAMVAVVGLTGTIAVVVVTQQRKDKNKLYALHAPEAECISKGKARTPYEFGVKVTVATTLKEGLNRPGFCRHSQTLKCKAMWRCSAF